MLIASCIMLGSLSVTIIMKNVTLVTTGRVITIPGKLAGGPTVTLSDAVQQDRPAHKCCITARVVKGRSQKSRSKTC